MIFHKVFLLLYCVAYQRCVGDQFETECGLEAADSAPLVKGGKNVEGNQFPWHVAIFHRKAKGLEQICGGSLVRSNLVISAAHCFSDRSHSHQVHLADYRVVGGIRLSSWNSTEIGRQESEVYEVRLGEEFGGSIRNFEDDIAIVQLMTAFAFSDTVRAVCLDLADAELNTNQTSPGSEGKVAGWGLTESDTTSDILKFLRVPVVAREECSDKLPSGFKPYLTSDKICAGLTNESAVCQGDSGGGLVFPLNESTGLQRWYLRGVLSNAPSAQNLNNRCLTKVFALYTNIFKHQTWLLTKMEDILPRGGGCRVRGSAGVCRNISDCAVARQDISLGFLPQYCLRPGLEVCCEEPNCPSLPHSTVNVRKTGSKALDYCVDLAEKLYPCQKGSSRWSRYDRCGHEPNKLGPRYWMNNAGEASPPEVQRYILVPKVEPEPDEFALGLPVFLVSERWLLTKATFAYYLPLPRPAEVMTTSVESFAINRRVRHPQFIEGPSSSDNNLELLEMDKPAIFSSRLRPLCLHTPQHSLEGLTLSRWGKFSETPAALLPQEECRRLYAPGTSYAPDGATDAHICVNFTSGCDHYSGYYLTASDGHCIRLLVGIHLGGVVEGDTCIHLYLRVAHYIPWVESVVWP